ncbi:hypothetical protein MRB53_041153 [Persea americana]|nr:hypothetical protein MRB53_041153 [Persea americana]
MFIVSYRDVKRAFDAAWTELSKASTATIGRSGYRAAAGACGRLFASTLLSSNIGWVALWCIVWRCLTQCCGDVPRSKRKVVQTIDHRSAVGYASLLSLAGQLVHGSLRSCGSGAERIAYLVVALYLFLGLICFGYAFHLLWSIERRFNWLSWLACCFFLVLRCFRSP